MLANIISGAVSALAILDLVFTSKSKCALCGVLVALASTSCVSPDVRVNDVPWDPAVLPKGECPDLNGRYKNAFPSVADRNPYVPELLNLVAGIYRRDSYVSAVETVLFVQVEHQWTVATRIERPRYSGTRLMSIEEAEKEDEILKQRMTESAEERKREVAAEREMEKKTGVRKVAAPRIPWIELPGSRERNAEVAAMTLSISQNENALVYETHWSDGRLAKKMTVRLDTLATGCKDGVLKLRTMSTLPARESSGSITFGENEVRKLGDGSLQVTANEKVQTVSSFTGKPTGDVVIRPTIARIYPAIAAAPTPVTIPVGAGQLMQN